MELRKIYSLQGLINVVLVMVQKLSQAHQKLNVFNVRVKVFSFRDSDQLLSRLCAKVVMGKVDTSHPA